MPESRDRLIREGPMTPILPRRPVHGGAIWIDTEQETVYGNGGRSLFGTPMQLGLARRSSLMGSRASPRIGYGGSPWRLYGNSSFGQENHSSLVGGSGRRGGRVLVRNNAATSSVLPSWYPRRSLQDITAVVDAVERRRARLRGEEDQRLASPLQHQFQTPVQHQELRTTSKKSYMTMAKRVEDESEFVTPQKRLLNSIDQVEKIMKEELKKMERTPSARRTERDNKVRRLMAMR